MDPGQRRNDNPVRGLGPTRARVLTLLQDAAQPMTAAEAAERLGLHPNSLRFHLDALADDSLVVRTTQERSTPGRPGMLYAASPTAPRVAHRSYRLLAQILSTVLSEELADPAGTAERAGRAWGRSLSKTRELSTAGRLPTRADGKTTTGEPDETTAVDTLVRTLDRIGFDSHRGTDTESLSLETSNCPFLEVAEERNDVICSVHLGLMRGILEEIGAPVTARTLEPLVEPSRCIAHLGGGGSRP